MIFVTVGQHPEGFDRLVQAADELASVIGEKVLIQRGGTGYTPTSARYFDFVDEAEMQRWLAQARVVVSHGGAGSILNALRLDKPLVIAPRLPRFGEVIDDHQLELSETLSQQGRVCVVTELSAERLRQAIQAAAQRQEEHPLPAAPPSSPSAGKPKLHDTLRTWLAEQSIRPAPWAWRWLPGSR